VSDGVRVFTETAPIGFTVCGQYNYLSWDSSEITVDSFYGGTLEILGFWCRLSPFRYFDLTIRFMLYILLPVYGCMIWGMKCFSPY